MKMISSIISRLVILICGTLYPAYASYKAVRTKNVKEYVKWMMYWIVFALFTCAETFTDVFLSWFPFYYEIKIILVIWLLSPATKGSSILYRKFVHPMLSKREHEIDEYIAKAKEQSYKQMLDLGSKGVNVLMQTAIKSLPVTASLVSSISDPHEHESVQNTESHIGNAHQEVEILDDTDMEYYEPSPVRPAKKPKAVRKGRPVRKSARNQQKTVVSDISD
uniref:Receptor expression-enhancing protein n=2 Tax=Photinus pyralis TaxID=7054 RepID=A0A1Y1L252_PHOPY